MGDSVPFSFDLNLTTVAGIPLPVNPSIALFNSNNYLFSAYVDWGDGTGRRSIRVDGLQTKNTTNPVGSYIRISGDIYSSKIERIGIYDVLHKRITSISGQFPTTLVSLDLNFNFADPSWSIPNIESIGFQGGLGPSSITTGSKLKYLLNLPSNLKYLDVSASTNLKQLDALPSGLTGINLSGITSLTSLDFSKIISLTNFSLPSSITSFSPPLGITGLSGLPTSILSLDLSKCTALTSLSSLPTRLRELYTPPGITGLSGLPNTITTLDLRSSSLLTSYGILPSGLQNLVTSSGITGISGLPAGLISIDLSASTQLKNVDLSGCTALASLPQLPSGVVSLNVSGCSSLTTLGNLPESLTNLRVENSGLTSIDLRYLPSLKELPTLPVGLQYLYTPSGITGVSGLPAGLLSIDFSESTGLKNVDLSGCTALASFLFLPSGVVSFNISGCSSLKTVGVLPPAITNLRVENSGLTGLNLSSLTSLKELPTLPVGLQYLSTPPGITGLPRLPNTITDLDLRSSSLLTSYGILPSGLQYFFTPSGITGISGLPAGLISINFSGSTGLKNVDLSGCTALRALPQLPSGVVSLNVSGCSSLKTLGGLPPAITNLRVENSGLTGLDLTGTNVATFDIPPAMISQLRYLKLTESKVQLSGLLNYQIPPGAEWILY